jgi:branched-subunit amino acid ABC-type transport system permease component
MYLLLSLGFTILFRVSDVANMAHGGFVAAGMYLAIVAVNDWGLPYAVAVPAVTVFSAIPIWLIYRVFIIRARPLGHRGQIVFTLLIMSLLQAIYTKEFGSEPATLHIKPASYTILGAELRTTLVVGFVVALMISVALFVVFRYTDLGRSLEVSGKHREAAVALGLPVDRYYAGVFVVGSGMGVMAGALIAGYSSVTPIDGFNYLTVAFLISFAGRLSFIGCLFAALTYGVGYQILVQTIGPTRSTVGIYVILLGVIILVSQMSNRDVLAKTAGRLLRRRPLAGAPT